MYSLGALTELRDPHDIFLLSYVNPFTRGDDFRTRLRIRRAGLLLAHVLEQRTVTACIVETDYRANARTRDTGGGPHLAFYTASALPVVLRYGLRQLVYNYEICHYWTHRFGSETYEPYFRRSRPEFNEFTAQAYRSLFGIQFDIANLSYFLSELLTYRIVLDRYPELHRSLLMCESRLGLTDRWCNACHKCWERVMFGLHCGHVDPSIDYDGFFRESEYVQKALRLSENRPAQPLENGNHAYVKGLTFAGHFQSHCHTLARCDFGQKNLKLGREARQNIDVLRERYGNKEYPIVE
jgi:hypothetical protein